MAVCKTPDTCIYLSCFVEEDDLIKGATHILSIIRPSWNKSNIKYKVFTDGITNKLVGCFYGSSDLCNTSDAVLVRVYGNKTDLLIDRKAELRSFQLLHKAGLAPELFAAFENGLAYGYAPGVTLTVESVLQPKIWTLVAKSMAQMHKLRLKGVDIKPSLFEQTERFLDLVPNPYPNAEKQKRLESELISLTHLKEEFKNLTLLLIKSDSPIVFAHNDLLLPNVIHNESNNTITFIDYEYAAYNHQAYDIANHFAEFVGLTEIDYSRYPSGEFQKQWLKEYLKEYHEVERVTQSQVDKVYAQVNRFVLASHFFWGVWALIQSHHSDIDFDYLDYAFIRFREYFKRKADIEP